MVTSTCLRKGGPIVYDTNVLKQLDNNTKHDTRYKVLSFGDLQTKTQ